ncbi:MAG: family 43 glycosylhydrolase [Polyangiaceae bacterium]
MLNSKAALGAAIGFALLLGFAAVWMNQRFEQRSHFSADMGDGTYVNPVLFADFSDPDVIRVGERYLLVASTFGRAPALTLMRSHDLVNWSFLPHPLEQLPDARFATPRHAEGVWAPSIRQHDGKLSISFPTLTRASM